MANINEVVMCVKWKSDANGNAPDFTVPVGCSWEDITGQPAESLPCTPNVYLIRARLTDAVYTAVNGNPAFIILARRQYDDAALEAVDIINTFNDKPTAAQLTTLKNLIITRFPGVDNDKLTDAGQAIFRAGLTRAEAIAILAKRWQQFIKAII
jgi:hypothetical protein